MRQVPAPDGADLPVPLPWATRAGTAPYVPGHVSELIANLMALLRGIDAEPLVDRSFTWPGADSPVPLRQVLHSLGSCGLFTREGRPARVRLTREARHFLASGDTTYLIAVLHAHVRFVGEALDALGTGLTHEELHRVAVDRYGLAWTSLDQVRRRVHWLRATGMAEYWSNGMIVPTAKGRAFVARVPPVRPGPGGTHPGAGPPVTLPEPPRLLAERLAQVTEGELRARRRVLGYIAGGANPAALSRLVDAAAAGVTRGEFVRFSAQAFDVAPSSAEQSLNTLLGLGLLAQVGPDRFTAGPLAAEWLHSGQVADLVRHLHLGLALLGETLDALADAHDSATLTRILSERYPDGRLTRKDVTARVALLVDTGLAERIGARTRRTPLGTALAGALPLQRRDTRREEATPAKQRPATGPERLAAEVVDAAGDGADPQRFVRAVAEAFRFLGADVEPAGSFGEPFGAGLVATLWLSPGTRRRIAVAVTTDTAAGVELPRPRAGHEADQAVLVGPGLAAWMLPATDREDVTVLGAEQLAEAVVRHSATPLGPPEVVALLTAAHAGTLARHWDAAERRVRAVALVAAALWKSANDPDEIDFSAGALDVGDIWRETKASLSEPLGKKEIEEALALLGSPGIAAVARHGTGHAIAVPPRTIAARLRSLADALDAQTAGTDPRRGTPKPMPPASSGGPLAALPEKNPSSPGIDAAHVRAWAQAEGRRVSDRGRLPQSLIRDYQRAHGLPADPSRLPPLS
ncbi:hypothetical protein ACIP3A_33905 [Streptomyces tricolor]|uniref:Lsr2 family DNA-binding protein n=1 Tax=Streptomyces tricolor TaxID=68277 RepID=UPI00380F7F7D